jgi:iron complex outermembrane receptor protein
VLKANLIAGVNGTLGPNHNQYYNPFGNSLLVPPTSPQYNSPSVLAQIEAPITNVALSTLTSLDAVVSGEPVVLWAGPLGVATGFQMRRESAKEDYDPLEVAGLLGINPIVYNFDGSDITYSYFGELRLPVLRGPYGKVEVSASGRYESDQYTSSFNPKFSLTYNYKWLTLLGSWGTSFVAPSVFQRQGDYGQGLLSVVDPLNGAAVQPPIFTVGSPKLSPEKSTAYSAGIKINPTASLSFGVNYWNIDFKNLLTTLTSQAEVNANPTGPNVIRDPASNQITEVLVPYINAGALRTDGFDFDVKYKIMGGVLGNFTPFITASDFNSYDAQVTATSPVIRGVGKDNSDNFGYPIAKWRLNTGINWERFNQTADVIMRYTSRVYDSTAEPQSAHPQIRVDVQYSYDFRKIIHGLKATIGVENVANAEPNVIPAKTLNYWMAYVQDAFPRRVYVTLDYAF